MMDLCVICGQGGGNLKHSIGRSVICKGFMSLCDHEEADTYRLCEIMLKFLSPYS